MEVYYKDLISEEASLDKLVDDLMLLVQGADEFAQAAGPALSSERRDQINERLHHMKQSYRWLKQHAVDSAVATDKILRRYPYSLAGCAFGIGLVAGALVSRKL